MVGINLEKHFSLSSSTFVQEICNRLLNSIGITYFNYIKIYNKDCSRELLTNNPEWIDHFYKNALYDSVGAVDVEHLIPKNYFLWSEMDIKDPIYLQGRDFFNIDNGITFIIKRKDVTYLYIFGSSRDQYTMNNFYLDNIDILQRFIHYFNDTAQKIITEVKDHKIYLPKPQQVNKNRVSTIQMSDTIRKQFFEETKVNRYFLLNESDSLYLTNKQASCAALMTKGFTSKQIAKTIGISYRTVEGYLLDIKHKVQNETNRTLTKDQLIQILINSNIRSSTLFEGNIRDEPNKSAVSGIFYGY